MRLSWRSVVPPVCAILALAIAVVPMWTATLVPLDQQPFPDAFAYADGGYQIANGNGFEISIDDTLRRELQPHDGVRHPSRYPPGFSLALATFVRLGDNKIEDTQRGSQMIAIALIIMLLAVTWFLAGPLAASIAVLVAAWSPFALKSAQIVMSDAFGAALALMILAAVAVARAEWCGTRLRTMCAAAAGLVTAYSILTRFSAGLTLICVVIALRRWPLIRAASLGALPVLVFLGAYQWTEFGHPLRTGYDYYFPDLKLVSVDYLTLSDPPSERKFIHDDRLDGRLMTWTCPCDEYGPIGEASNIVFYPAVILGLYWIYYPPLFSLFGLWAIWRRRSSAAAQFAALLIATNVAIASVYFYQAARLVAPAAFVLLAYSANGVVDVCKVAGRLGRGILDRWTSKTSLTAKTENRKVDIDREPSAAPEAAALHECKDDECKD